MTSAKKAGRFGQLVNSSVAAWMLCLTTMCPYGAAMAQQWPVSPRPPQEHVATLPMASLEKAFWACDYAATTRGMDATPVDVCTAVTDALKNVKFGGRFEDLLAWWQVNKPAEHQKLATDWMQAGAK